MTPTFIQRPAPSRVPTVIVGTLLSVAPLGASSQAIALQRELGNVRIYLESSASSIRNRRRDRFHTLARQWRHETELLSSTMEMAMHPAYQAIIGMGPAILPEVVTELRERSGHWYWALKAISNEDPVPPCDRGNIKRMKAAWLQWAMEKGILNQ